MLVDGIAQAIAQALIGFHSNLEVEGGIFSQIDLAHAALAHQAEDTAAPAQKAAGFNGQESIITAIALGTSKRLDFVDDHRRA